MTQNPWIDMRVPGQETQCPSGGVLNADGFCTRDAAVTPPYEGPKMANPYVPSGPCLGPEPRPSPVAQEIYRRNRPNLDSMGRPFRTGIPDGASLGNCKPYL